MWVCFHDDSKINKTREVKHLIQAKRLEKSSVFFQTHKFEGQNNLFIVAPLWIVERAC